MFANYKLELLLPVKNEMLMITAIKHLNYYFLTTWKTHKLTGKIKSIKNLLQIVLNYGTK